MTSESRVISVIGLGYVGLPLAASFAKQFRTIGFDLKMDRIQELQRGYDRTREVCPEDLRNPNLQITHDPAELRKADFHIVAVPTPVDDAKRPDLTPLLRASESVGRVLKKGDIVVFESTVYPGATEEECLPILEKLSGLKAPADFTVGYSPERINPGDKEHAFTDILKVVSGQTPEALEAIAATYGRVVKAGVFKAQSIKVAEAAKVIENTQRDLNIALMNELALIFNRMGIDTRAVLDAAGTKWNFVRFFPGLVGGHCIGVDPYYLTHKAEKLGYHPQVILAGRRINDAMGGYVARMTIKELSKAGHPIHGNRVTVLGLTFKEDCPDTRNTRVVDIIRELADFGIEVQVCDPIADENEAQSEYGLQLTPIEALKPAAAVVVAVAHKAFKELAPPQLRKLLGHKSPILVDVKSIYPAEELSRHGIKVWRL